MSNGARALSPSESEKMRLLDDRIALFASKPQGSVNLQCEALRKIVHVGINFFQYFLLLLPLSLYLSTSNFHSNIDLFFYYVVIGI